MPRPSDMRYEWVCVRLNSIDVDELRELLIDAWRMCVPKKVAAAHAGSQVHDVCAPNRAPSAVSRVGRRIGLVVGAIPSCSHTFLRNDERERSLPLLRWLSQIRS
jgi:hypothetical protein